jgi:Rrf2 family protein
MQLTRGCEYAIRGLVYLAMQKQGEPVLLADIAKGIDAPANYLSNIFQNLVRLGLVTSHFGAKRGYTLTRPPKDINLREIVEGLEGPITIASCTMMATPMCTQEGECSMGDVWQDIQDTIVKKLEKANLSKLTGACFLHPIE